MYNKTLVCQLFAIHIPSLSFLAVACMARLLYDVIYKRIIEFIYTLEIYFNLISSYNFFFTGKAFFDDKSLKQFIIYTYILVNTILYFS